jgi:hypothetical protein
MHVKVLVSRFVFVCRFLIQRSLKLFHTPIRHLLVIDLEAFGFGGDRLPDILAKSLETTTKNEPLLWQTILTDPVAKRVLENPIAAVKEIVGAAMDASDYKKPSA